MVQSWCCLAVPLSLCICPFNAELGETLLTPSAGLEEGAGSKLWDFREAGPHWPQSLQDFLVRLSEFSAPHPGAHTTLAGSSFSCCSNISVTCISRLHGVCLQTPGCASFVLSSGWVLGRGFAVSLLF